MRAAAKILHRAIEDAVHQLEPQLLPLFGSDRRTSYDAAPHPTQRTQMAFRTVLALTRFFPEAHRVRKAGRQLALLWPPLVHEPRGVNGGKLLHHYFRLRQDLVESPELALRRAMRELARAASEEAQVPDSAARIAACEQRLRILACLLPTSVAAPAVELSALARLFVWQQRLESALVGTPALGAVLLPELRALLERCGTLCRASDWSLDYFCSTALAQALWQAIGLARFGGNTAMAEVLEALDDECLDLHLRACTPQTAQLQQWLVRLFAALQGRAGMQPVLPCIAAVEAPLHAIYARELAQYRRQLQEDVQGASEAGADTAPVQNASAALPSQRPTLRVTASMITLLYKLTWLFSAAEQASWARLCHCAYRVVLQHWRSRRPLPDSCHTILRELALQAGAPLSDTLLRRWRRQVLRSWSNWTDDTKRPIALRPEAGEVVALEAVPDLLSASFTTLVQAGAVKSATARGLSFQELLQQRSTELLQELALLEKGAAAMRVWPLEQLCTLLLAVYEAHLRDAREVPLVLLQDAHRQLVRMLDQAAAWHEVQVAEDCVRKLENWLSASSALLTECREPAASERMTEPADCEPALRAQLLSCLGTLASVLERPVRLQLDAGKLRLDDDRMTQLLDCVRPLIKFMLLDQSVDARTRNAMHRPRVSTLTLALRATSATLVVTVGEDSHDDVLPHNELQRLQRRLPKTAGPLACESRAGHGRCFTFTLH